MGFRERDYLKKQLEGLAKVLAAILGLKDAGRVDEARAELERARTDLVAVLPADHPWVQETEAALAALPSPSSR